MPPITKLRGCKPHERYTVSDGLQNVQVHVPRVVISGAQHTDDALSAMSDAFRVLDAGGAQGEQAQEASGMSRTTALWLATLGVAVGWMLYLTSLTVQLGQAIEQQQTIVQVAPVVIEREVVERPVFWNSLDTETYKATAYTNGPESTGKRPGHPQYGITKSGLPTRPGVCATDPDVIPLGSILWVEEYGFCVALDTGSAVRGKHVDVWMERVEDARQWGVKQLQVAVVR